MTIRMREGSFPCATWCNNVIKKHMIPLLWHHLSCFEWGSAFTKEKVLEKCPVITTPKVGQLNWIKPCTKINKRWWSVHTIRPTKASTSKMNVLKTPSLDSKVPLKTLIFVFIKKLIFFKTLISCYVKGLFKSPTRVSFASSAFGKYFAPLLLDGRLNK